MVLQVIAKILLILFLLAAPFLLYGFGGELLKIIAQISLKDLRWTAFTIGFVVFLPFHFLAKRLFSSVWNYLQTLEHELTHLLVGLVFLKIPVGIRVSAHSGGEVRQIGFGAIGQTWISLAPYFFPTVSIFVVVLAYFIGANSRIMPGLLGFSTAFHLVTNWAETSFRQTDLQKAGLVKTILILPVMNTICYGSILAFVAGGDKGFGAFWFEGVSSSLKLFGRLF